MMAPTNTPKTVAELLTLSENASRAKADAKESRIVEQYAAVMAFCKPHAERGLREARENYLRDLLPETVARLRRDGMKVRDDGENVASSYHLSW